MEDSEEGEWIRYDEHKKEVERLKTNCDLYREMNKDMYLKYEKEYRLANHLTDRVNILFFVLMATYGAIVGKLIGWSLGL